MKKILIALACLFPFIIVSCGSSGTSKKAIEDGKVAIVSKEYEKARDLFQLAVNEDNKSILAKDLLDLCNNYILLLDVLNSGEYQTVDELIDNIEGNKELDIIRSNYETTKKLVLENKDIVLKNSEEISTIENLLNEGNIDEAKLQATAKLEEVKGHKALEDRLNNVINKVNEIIEDAKNEIIKYHSGEEVVYAGLKETSYNSYNNVSALEGKTLLLFEENQQFGSPREYMYDRDSGNIYSLNQGMYLLVNNNNEVVYEIKEPVSNNINTNENISATASEQYLSKDEAIAIAKENFKIDFPAESNFNAVAKDMYAECYEIDMFDAGGRLLFATYVVHAKSGSCWRM